jgi:curli biogenesis system outer membrane secretion channel CsgG
MDGGLQIIAVSGVLRSSGAGALGGRRIQITSQDTKPLLNPDSPIVIAVMDLAPLQVQPDTGGAVAEMIRNRISGAKNVAMVERQRMPDIKREQGFQYSDLADPDTAVRLGRAIGARKMIFGSLSKLGATYTINVRMVDVETSLIDGVREVQCRACTEDDLPEAVAELKEAVVGSNR